MTEPDHPDQSPGYSKAEANLYADIDRLLEGVKPGDIMFTAFSDLTALAGAEADILHLRQRAKVWEETPPELGRDPDEREEIADLRTQANAHKAIILETIRSREEDPDSGYLIAKIKLQAAMNEGSTNEELRAMNFTSGKDLLTHTAVLSSFKFRNKRERILLRHEQQRAKQASTPPPSQ